MNNDKKQKERAAKLLRSALDKLTNEELVVLSGFLIQRHSEFIDRFDYESTGTIGVIGKVVNPNNHLEWIGTPELLEEIRQQHLKIVNP